MLILVAVTVRVALNGGLFSTAKEASFRTEMSEVRDIVDLYLIEKQMGSSVATKMNEIPLDKAEKWDITLKKEIIYWGDYELEINQATDNYIKENFSNLAANDSGYLNNIFYIENSDLGEEKYIYNASNDIVYKIKKTSIGKYSVHSIEELDYLKNGGTRQKNKSYTKIEYEVEFRKIGDVSCYEPNLNGLAKETTSLVFYKLENAKVTEEEYTITAEEWLNKGRPNQITQNGYEYILYDYENKIWANIRVISGSIETYWTWIPRYSYRNNTANTSPTTEVEFLRTTDETPENYELAASFEGNDKKGLWTSKYEPSYKIQTNALYFSYYIPDLSQFDAENTYIEVYNKDTGYFEKEVKVAEAGNLTIFSQNNLWFDYDNQIWANIKVVKNGIETWWVWIPRYAYTNGGNTTDIVFIDTNNKPLDGSTLSNTYEIAGAFDGNDKKGIWVSKYEPSAQTVTLTENSNTPDVSNLDAENTYIQIYDKSTGNFKEEVKLSTISDLNAFSKNKLWYDYKDKIWANIKVVKNGIETWWVWIPRYAYSNGGNTTDIVLITADNKLLNGKDIPSSYTIAEMFDSNNKAGMWVSKYEPSSQE